MEILSLLLMGTLVTFSPSWSMPPTELVEQSVQVSDDLDFKELDRAIERQLANFDRRGLKGGIQFGHQVYPKKLLRKTLIEFQELAFRTQRCLTTKPRQACMKEFNRLVNQKFHFFRPLPLVADEGFGQNKTTKFTAYYSPDLDGSFWPTKQHRFPLYVYPEDPGLQTLSREEIDFDGKLAGKSLELFWISDPLYDVYLFHVQGGGRVTVRNNGEEKSYYVSYAGENGRPFNFVYHYMVERGMLTLANRGIEHQRNYIENNPHSARDIFSTNESYVFFKITKQEPLGIESIPLTVGRSIALDRRLYHQSGLLQFIQTPVGDINSANGEKILKRFFIYQDTGGAIRGRARCDLYMGYGKGAEYTAYHTNNMGMQFFLLLKE